MLEADYQAQLIKKLELLFPGCFILKNDSGYLSGFPDLTIFYGCFWAVLEVKPRMPHNASDFEPGQVWYLTELAQQGFAACIYPENEKEVLDALVQTLRAGG